MKKKSESKSKIDFTKFHGFIVRHEGVGHKIIAHRVGPLRLAQAENVLDKTTVNLVSSRSPLAMSIRQSLGVGNYIVP